MQAATAAATMMPERQRQGETRRAAARDEFEERVEMLERRASRFRVRDIDPLDEASHEEVERRLAIVEAQARRIRERGNR
jgi:hypothetical protein